MSHLLIVDDDPNTLASLARAFRLAGHEATVADRAVRALELVRTQTFDLIFSDVVMPDKDGITFLEELRAAGVTTPVVMISGQATLEMAVRATRLGAHDFLEKPLSTEKLLVTLETVLKLKRLESENRELRARLGRHEIVWKSEVMRRVMAQVERVAASDSGGKTRTAAAIERTVDSRTHPMEVRPELSDRFTVVPARSKPAGGP